jgi:hypothetical protein
MESVQIALITPNKITFDRISEYVKPMIDVILDDEERSYLKSRLNEYIWDEIKEYVQFKSINPLELQDEIVDHVVKSFPYFTNQYQFEQLLFETETTHCTPKKVYQFVHAINLIPDSVPMEPNSIGSYIHLFDSNEINHNIVLMAFDYASSQSHVRLASFGRDDIVRLIRRRCIRTAILIRQNDVKKIYYEYPYSMIKSIWNVKDEQAGIQKISTVMLKYNLSFYSQSLLNTDLYANEMATRLNAIKPIHGECIVVHELDENVYTNLSQHEFRRLNVLAYGSDADRLIKSEEILSQDVSDDPAKKPIIWNKFVITSERIKLWNDKKKVCFWCSKKMILDNIYKCEKCWRIRCCSAQCLLDCRHDCI